MAQNKKISIGINKSSGECVSFENLICPYCFREIGWNTFYPKVDNSGFLQTEASVTKDFICPHCHKTMSVGLDVLITSEKTEN